MWYNELLFVLMFIALIGMGVLALIVTVNMRQKEGSIKQKAEIPEKKYEPEKNMRLEPIKIVENPIPEPEPVETIEINEALFKPIIIQAVEPESTPEPAVEPLLMPIVEAAEPLIEPMTETIDELIVEPPLSPAPEPQPTPPESSPKKMKLRRETENKFFDLRYEYNPPDVAADSPTILDKAPSIDLEEEEKEEPLPGVVTCPHCKSEVPQTLYCIYCGNTLSAKPQSAAGK
jgi:hypothetical protein